MEVLAINSITVGEKSADFYYLKTSLVYKSKFQESQGCPEKPCVVGVGGECSNNQEAHSSTLDAKVRS